jgi:hypothetical protein
MAELRTRKNKENPHYGFLVSWPPAQRASWPEGQPKQASEARVKRESNLDKEVSPAIPTHGKRAESLAQDELATGIKRNIYRSLILVGLILILELVVYLAWNKFI